MKAEEEYHKPSKLIACQSWYVPLKGKVIASGYLKPAIFTILRGRQYNPPATHITTAPMIATDV